MAPERNKGQAGLGGKGKNQLKHRQDQATRNKRKTPSLGKRQVPGKPAGSGKKALQKENQRRWHQEKKRRVRKQAQTEPKTGRP
jgi:hypothetical protein